MAHFFTETTLKYKFLTTMFNNCFVLILTRVPKTKIIADSANEAGLRSSGDSGFQDGLNSSAESVLHRAVTDVNIRIEQDYQEPSDNEQSSENDDDDEALYNR